MIKNIIFSHEELNRTHENSASNTYISKAQVIFDLRRNIA